MNLSNGGIAFTTETYLPIGSKVEVSVDWPAKLDGRCALKFIAIGHVLRSHRYCAVITLDSYEFKVRGSSFLPHLTPGEEPRPGLPA